MKKVLFTCLVSCAMISTAEPLVELNFTKPEFHDFWKSPDSTVRLRHDPEIGHDTAGSLAIDFPGNNRKVSGVYCLLIPFQPGWIYKAEFSIRVDGLEENDQITASFQPRTAGKKELRDNKEVPAVLSITRIAAGKCRNWKRIVLLLKAPPEKPAWKDVAYLLLTVGGSSQKAGIIRIDDMKIFREGPAEVPAKSAKSDGRTFELSFDSGANRADFATADDRPLEDIPVTCIPGFNGKNAFRQTASGKRLRYPAAGNANPLNGTAVIWFRADNFEPFNPKHNGWNIHPITLFRLHFGSADDKWADLWMVLYRGADAGGFRLGYDNSGQPKNVFGSYPTVQVPLNAVHRGEWHQFACVWDDGDLAVYMDGKFYGRCYMTENKRAELRHIIPDSAASFIALRNGPEEQSLQRGEVSDVDDFVIYNRVLTPAEIKQLYVSATSPGKAAQEQLLSATFSGTKSSEGSEAVEAKLDFTVVRNQLWRDEASRNVRYEISGPDGLKKTGNFTVGKNSMLQEKLSGLNAPGKYTMKLFFPGENTAQVTATECFDKPDTSWAGTGCGAEDSTPAPWTPPVLDAEHNRVTVWNRVYSFDSGGPFPSDISIGGRKLLTVPPALEIDTAAGESVPRGRITGHQSSNSSVTFTGTLTAREFDASYSTTVEFDGFVKTELLVKRATGLRAMRVIWQVSPEFSHHLLLPAPDTAKEPQRDFPYFCTEARILYLASESGGFCWMPTGELNWVFKPGEKVWHANKSTGKCSLDIITHPVEMPKNTPYTFCFIATPTRPVMTDFRSWRFIGGSNKAKGDVMLHTAGFTRNGNLRVSEEALLNWKKDLGPRCLNVYAATSFLESSNPEAIWFADDWLTYGYFYSMGGDTAIPSCINTSKADFLAYNTKMSLSDPGFNHIDGYYFDCCSLSLCPNRLHGCRVVDNFGRDVMKTNLLPLRDYIKRIIRLLHSQNRRLGAHGQFSFIPGIHGLCDYWLTGEELRMDAIRDGVEIYCDRSRVTDAHLRVNSNRGIFGGVEPCVLIYSKDNEYKHQMPAITRLLAEDIKVAGWFGAEGYNRMDKVWDAFKKYGADKAKCHRYFEQKEVTSSNPEVVVTRYDCPENSMLLIAANFSGKSIETVIDLGTLRKGNASASDEISGAPIPVSDGKLNLVIPPRDFRLIGIKSMPLN